MMRCAMAISCREDAMLSTRCRCRFWSLLLLSLHKPCKHCRLARFVGLDAIAALPYVFSQARCSALQSLASGIQLGVAASVVAQKRMPRALFAVLAFGRRVRLHDDSRDAAPRPGSRE